MSEIGDVFDALKERSKKKKKSNIESSTLFLIGIGFEVDIKNNGLHLIVSRNGVVADFWPSTGKFIVRGGKAGRGIKTLIKQLKIKPTLEQESNK